MGERMVFIALLMSCVHAKEPTPRFDEIRMVLKGIEVVVEVADEPHERQLGLMYRKEMPDNKGMIFVYSKESVRSFWMKNTYIPLSIAFLSKEGVVLSVKRMKPMDLTPISSVYPAQYALEMNQGWFKRHEIEVGYQVGGLPMPK